MALTIRLLVDELTRLLKKAKPTSSCDKYHKCLENLRDVDFEMAECIDEYSSSDLSSSRSMEGAPDA